MTQMENHKETAALSAEKEKKNKQIVPSARFTEKVMREFTGSAGEICACKASVLPIVRRAHDRRGRGDGDGEIGGAERW